MTVYDILKEIFTKREYKKDILEPKIAYNIFSEEYALNDIGRKITSEDFCKEHPEFVYFQSHYNKISWRRYKKYCQHILQCCFPVWCHTQLITVQPLQKLTGAIFKIKVKYSNDEE